MKHILPAVIAVVALALPTLAGAQDKPEVPKVRLAVGGKSAIFYLPLSVTERLGYFKSDDASFVGTGVTSTAVAAARRSEIGAIVSSDPMISLMQGDGLVEVVADTRTPGGTQAVYGGPYPGGVVYTTPSFVAKNPRTVQAIVTAFVRALKWMSSHSAEDIAGAMPEDYALGNREVYVRALAASQAMYSPDGRFVPGGVETAYQVLKVFDRSVAGARLDLSKTYIGTFVEKALATH